MHFPRLALFTLVFAPLPLRAENPYNYRYGSAAYERAVADRRSDERLNAPVTNGGGYSPDMSSTINQIRQTMGTRLTPEQRFRARQREDEEAEDRRIAYDRGAVSWTPPAAPEPPREVSYTERLQNLAREGNSEAMRIIGQAQINFENLPDIYAQGLNYLEKAADKGNEGAAKALIAHYNSNPKLNKFPRVIELMTDLADRGDAHFTRELGEAYLNGIPGKIEPDAKKAFRFLNEGFTRWADGTCGLALARAYRDGKLFPKDTAKAIATYRQLIYAQSKRDDIMNPPRYNTGAAGWEWFELVQQADPDLKSTDPEIRGLWEYAALHGEPHTRAATHLLAAELGRIYEGGINTSRDTTKAILFLSIATSGEARGKKSSDYDEVVLSNESQARHLFVLARLLLDVAPAWPKIDRKHALTPSTPADIARLYTLACSYAIQPDAEGNLHPCPSPFLALYHLSFDKNYGLKLDDGARLALLDRAIELGDTPNDPEDPDYADYAELLYERARLVRNLGELMPDTQHRAALGFEKAWAYGYLPAALPLAELIDDLRLPGKTREDAKAVCRLAAENGEAYCAAQLGTWLTGEIVEQTKPDPAMVEEARAMLTQAAEAGIYRAEEDQAVLCAALGEFDAAVVHFKNAMEKAPSPRNQAGYAELLATGKGGLKADPAQALKLLEEASEQDALYTVRLAEIIQRAQWGTTKNMETVIKLLDRALMRDNEWRAGIVLARLYHTGTDVAKDEAKAFEYIEATGVRGNNEAARVIAAGYEKGDIIDRNAEEAARWKKISIEGLVLDPG